MKIYLVGGAVRDKIQGIKASDHDYVVTDSDIDEMLSLGFQQVGKHFPVFLHPQTKEEYALARTEVKLEIEDQFIFNTKNVSLEEDLERRELTINSIAMDDQGLFIDPFDGINDLKNKILRHTSDAFIEDPLRVFRVARFATRFSNFTIAPETINIMKALVRMPSFKLLSNERVFGEMEKALKYDKPSIFFEVLREVDGLDYFFPELKNLIGVPQRVEYHPEGCAWTHTMMVLDHSTKNEDIRIRYSALVHDLGKGVTPKEKLPSHPGHEESGLPLVQGFGTRLHVPNDWTEAALVVTAHHLRVHRIGEMKPNSIVKMFYEIDAFRKPDLVRILARACEADEMGKEREQGIQGSCLERYFEIVKDIGFKDIKPGLKGEAIKNAIRELRVSKLRDNLKQS